MLDAIGDACYKNTLLRNDVEGSMNPSAIAFFNLHTMLVATNNFSQANKLGEGGFGLVYKVFIFSTNLPCFSLSFIRKFSMINTFMNMILGRTL